MYQTRKKRKSRIIERESNIIHFVVHSPDRQLLRCDRVACRTELLHHSFPKQQSQVEGRYFEDVVGVEMAMNRQRHKEGYLEKKSNVGSLEEKRELEEVQGYKQDELEQDVAKEEASMKPCFYLNSKTNIIYFITCLYPRTT